MTQSRQLRVFICHSSNDKPVVRDLYQRLNEEGWIDPWLDSEKLNPGDSWAYEIEKAVEETDIILVCLSKQSVNKEGYVQRELRIALDFADYKPEGTVFIIPVRLEECEPPKRLRAWQYADFFPQENRDQSYQKLLNGLKKRANGLQLPTERSIKSMQEALKEADLEEDAKLVNQVIQKSLLSAERVKEQIRETLTYVSNEELDEAEDYDEVEKRIRIPLPVDKYYLYTIDDGIALRSHPSLDGKLLDRLTANTKVISLELKIVVDAKVGVPGQWIHVQTPDETQGYVAAWFLIGNNEYQNHSFVVAPLPTAEAAFRTEPLVASETLIRVIPNTENLVCLEPVDVAVKKIGVVGQWLKVRDQENQFGYVAAWWLTKANPFFST
jgi:hypothetical protein